jgi:hypothetical protein
MPKIEMEGRPPCRPIKFGTGQSPSLQKQPAQSVGAASGPNPSGDEGVALRHHNFTRFRSGRRCNNPIGFRGGVLPPEFFHVKQKEDAGYYQE